jgi:hypothetical protein
VVAASLVPWWGAACGVESGLGAGDAGGVEADAVEPGEPAGTPDGATDGFPVTDAPEPEGGDASKPDVKDPGEPDGDAPGPGPDGDAPSEDAPEPDVPVACLPPAEPGCPCLHNEDCTTGWCVPTSDGYRCTKECDAECPEGFSCKGVNNAAGDPVFLCVPLYTNLCRPCTTGADCDQLGGTGGYCLPYQDGSGSFCGGLCSEDQPCPEGYACQDVKVAGGLVVKQCLRTDGECPCSPIAVKEVAATTCWVKNAFGKCTAPRVCGDDGTLTPCLAETPESELCNLEDDDCDGDIDEEVSEPCKLSNAFGTCFGQGVCENGVFLDCDAPEPKDDVCNGEDDDCDLLTDEGFPDSDGDGEADCVDEDRDGDSVPNDLDNCPDDENADQADMDQDGLGDACDPDLDGDGSPNGQDCDPEDPEHVCTTYFWDGDADGAPVCNVKKCLCGPQSQYTETSCSDETDDCDDTTPVFKPGALELCDSEDQDCDGLVDETFLELSTPCDGGDLDGCANGHVVCSPNGKDVFCDEAPGVGEVELCDGSDDDCDGETDEDWPELGLSCDGLDTDLCENGLTVCAKDGSGAVCSPETPSDVAESCNGQDDDCDGKTDEVFSDLGKPCDGPDPDQCANGKHVCSPNGAGTTCGPEGPPTLEACNGQDDDCDGVTDEDWPEIGLECDGDDPDTCEDGRLECAADELTLTCGDEDPVGPVEVCDTVDNDCDGKTDEDWPDLGETCDGGDTDQCENGFVVCDVDLLGTTCSPESPASIQEACGNAIDDDCDGLLNEGCKPTDAKATMSAGFGPGSVPPGHAFGMRFTVGEAGPVGRLQTPGKTSTDLGLLPTLGGAQE